MRLNLTKNDPIRCNENKERIKKQQKSKHKPNRLKNKLKTIFPIFCFRFINLF